MALVIAGLSLLPATAQAQKPPPPDQTTPPKETPQPPPATPQAKTPADTPVEQPTLPKWQTLPRQQCPASDSDEKITALADKLPTLEARQRLQEAAYQNDKKNAHALQDKLGVDDPKTIAAYNQMRASVGKVFGTEAEINALESRSRTSSVVRLPHAALPRQSTPRLRHCNAGAPAERRALMRQEIVMWQRFKNKIKC